MIIIILITILLIALLAISATPSVKLHNNYKKPIQIILPLLIIGLGFFLTKIIMDPIKFEKEKNYRYNFIKQKLIDIRSAELAFKEKNGFFTNDFEKLIPFVKLDSFVIVEKTDTLIGTSCKFSSLLWAETITSSSTLAPSCARSGTETPDAAAQKRPAGSKYLNFIAMSL